MGWAGGGGLKRDVHTRTCIKTSKNENKGTPYAGPSESDEELHQLSTSRLREAAASPVNARQTCHFSAGGPNERRLTGDCESS